MQDWRGVPIEEGDTIVLVRIFVEWKFQDFVYKDPINKKLYLCEHDHKIWQNMNHRLQNGTFKIEFGWEVTHESEVINEKGILWMEPPIEMGKPPGPENEKTFCPIDMIWDVHKEFNRGERGNFICIKGISDNHENFYKHYFRSNMSGMN